MATDQNARLAEIVSLLRPVCSGKFPESLTAAALDGDIEAMDLFLSRGANIDQRSGTFSSPLGAACSAGQIEAVRWLVSKGATLDPPNSVVTPIQSALGKGYCDIAAVLLDAGLPLEKAAWGVDAAVLSGNVPMLLWLVSRGIDLDQSYPRLGVLRERAVKLAETNAKHEMLTILKMKEFPVPIPNEPPSGKKPEAPVRAPEGERSQLLAEAARILQESSKGAARFKSGRASGPRDELLISYAAQMGVIEVVQMLLDGGAEIDYAPEGTAPPLYNAAAGGHLELVRLLLERKASVNGKDGKSWLPLVGALTSGNPEIVKLLIASGAKTNTKTADRRKPDEYVRGPYAPEIQKLLEQTRKSRS